MKHDDHLPSRRQFLSAVAIGAFGSAAFFTTPGLYAEQLVLTPRQTEGPFYPNPLPLDTDNDLLVVDDSITPAVGAITHLRGRVLDRRGTPIRGAVVEIWQVDNNGVYLHGGSANGERRDPNFQGFGRFETASDGEYYFRTIKPVSYPGRVPHIHVGVKVKGHEMFTTQCYVKGHPGNARDGVLRSIGDQRAIDSVVVDFKPIAGSRTGELAARFDVVLGYTPVG